jgi:hypothetical protein
MMRLSAEGTPQVTFEHAQGPASAGMDLLTDAVACVYNLGRRRDTNMPSSQQAQAPERLHMRSTQ